jgi:hypothetical protein
VSDTLPTTMRAVVHETFAEPADVLGVEQRPVPQPAAGQVLVRTVLSPAPTASSPNCPHSPAPRPSVSSRPSATV